MNVQRENPDFDLLALAADRIKHEFIAERPEWIGSPFEWILRLPPASKGKLGRRLVYQWCALQDLAVDKSPDSEADMQINGHRVEVKLSTWWRGGGYTFQQFRDQNYKFAVCFGISPFDAHCWVISKTILRKNVIGHLGQHTGATGQETAWFSVDPATPSEWLKGCGGSLSEALIVIRNMGRRK